MTQEREGLEWTSLCKCCSMVVHLAHELTGTRTNTLSYASLFHALCVCICHIKISAYSYFQTCKSLTTCRSVLVGSHTQVFSQCIAAFACTEAIVGYTVQACVASNTQHSDLLS